MPKNQISCKSALDVCLTCMKTWKEYYAAPSGHRRQRTHQPLRHGHTKQRATATNTTTAWLIGQTQNVRCACSRCTTVSGKHENRIDGKANVEIRKRKKKKQQQQIQSRKIKMRALMKCEPPRHEYCSFLLEYLQVIVFAQRRVKNREEHVDWNAAAKFKWPLNNVIIFVVENMKDGVCVCVEEMWRRIS